MPFRYFVLSLRNNALRYFGAKSKIRRRNFAFFRLFVISSFRHEITKKRSLSLFRGEFEKTQFAWRSRKGAILLLFDFASK